MNTESTYGEDVIDLGAFDVETKGQQGPGQPDSPTAPTRYASLGLSED